MIADYEEKKGARVRSYLSAVVLKAGETKTHCLSFKNNCKFTSKTVFNNPIFAP